ncbi:A/G-specific adenine glycosylase [Georgenia yuyongxinii]|uniref:Adenine DNA glycosylase n=1 Tax=Georgenia yuyongxinii TaxID=2589797 RepID=A0A5B8C8Z7_9MICO|nr:A/G-specific adenine glycosylase [Georgenia yuyongxinii]QDC25991.1 A/G-specific adenine glycosylase [Georgenia yuyongxinii]
MRPDLPTIRSAVLAWFETNARDLPWRRPGTSAWAVLVSEIMLQQTPVARVEPVWRAWLTRWPAPADLAVARPADVLRAWDRLGYPRRALRLQECARVITAEHDGVVPDTEAGLLALPGIGQYTAAAVAAFAHGRNAVVLDTNVRRVLTRAMEGRALPPPTLGRAERERAASHLPTDPATSVRWNVGLMELGALVCTARSPRCTECPLREQCAWLRAGRPADEHAARRRTQAWHGTDRQVRGRIMAHLRAHPPEEWAATAELLTAGADGADPRALPDPGQPARALASLVADGLVAAGTGVQAGWYRLP